MPASNLIRLGALAAVVGGVLFLVGPVATLFPVEIALLLVPVGMLGFHVLQKHSYGRRGLAGFWLVVVGTLVFVPECSGTRSSSPYSRCCSDMLSSYQK